MRHTKLYGYVEDLYRDGTWGAKVWNPRDPEDPFFVHMNAYPLHPDARRGTFFTWHRTKRGDLYLYWPPRKPLTNSQRKRLRRETDRMFKLFAESGHWITLPAGWLAAYPGAGPSGTVFVLPTRWLAPTMAL